jgi:hypothetical protein
MNIVFLKRFYPASQKIDAYLLSLAFLVLLYLLVKGFFEFPIAWDFLAYHLPFALLHYDLTTYSPPDYLMDIFNAFPPLPHLLQGFLIKLTGSFNSASALNAISLIGMILLLKLLNSGVRLSFFAWLLLSIPLVVIHMTSGYIDLFVGVSVTILFAATREIAMGKFCTKNMLIFGLALCVAMFSKYQTWPFCFLCSFFILLKFSVTGNDKSRFVSFQFASCVSVILCILLYWPIRNFLIFNNPTYPIQPPVLSYFYEFSGLSLEKGMRIQQIPQRLWDVSNVRLFWESVLETSRFFAPGFKYSVDQGGYDGGAASPHFRMGGWSPLFIFLSFGWLLTSGRNLSEMFWSFAPLICGLLFLFFVPQSHELRYWLFLPMTLAYFCCLDLERRTPRSLKVFSILTLLCVAWNIFQVRDEFRLNVSSAADFAPSDALNASSATPDAATVTCVVGKLPYTIFWAGKDFNTFRVKDCTKY